MLKDLIKTPGSIKLLEENMEEVPQDIILCENFRVRLQKHKRKIRHMGLYQRKEHLHSKENNYQSKETADRMGENLCKLCDKGLMSSLYEDPTLVSY